jgi:hypothetical protein
MVLVCWFLGLLFWKLWYTLSLCLLPLFTKQLSPYSGALFYKLVFTHLTRNFCTFFMKPCSQEPSSKPRRWLVKVSPLKFLLRIIFFWGNHRHIVSCVLRIAFDRLHMLCNVIFNAKFTTVLVSLSSNLYYGAGLALVCRSRARETAWLKYRFEVSLFLLPPSHDIHCRSPPNWMCYEVQQWFLFNDGFSAWKYRLGIWLWIIWRPNLRYRKLNLVGRTEENVKNS